MTALRAMAALSEPPDSPAVTTMDEDLAETFANARIATFQELLDQVAAKHARDVAELALLQRRVAVLQRKLDAKCAADAKTFRRSRSAMLNYGLDEDGPDSLPGIPAAPEVHTHRVKLGELRTCGSSSSNAACRWKEHVKPVWLQALDRGRLSAAKQSTMNSLTVFHQHSVPDTELYSGALRHFIAYPSSPTRMIWDAIGAVLIFYDLFAIPLLFTFLPPISAFLSVMDWLTLAFWTSDVFASFLVGYVKDGITHMFPKSIALRYAKTWLLIDLLVVVPDWCFTLGDIGDGVATGSESVKLIRILRLMRIVRLLRLFKLRRIVQNLDELIDSEYVCIFASIGKMILLLLVINHYISCAWFLVGTSDPSTSWVRQHGFESDHWSYQYFTAAHWGITQFTPASMDVQPHNIQERIFAIAVVVFALVGFSYVVGSITGSLSQLRSMQENLSKQIWTLRCYLKQNRVPIALGARVQRYLEHACKSQQENVSIDKIPLFSLLSDQLRSELQFEMFVPQLSVHPLLSHLNTESSVTMGRLANTAISRKVYALHDTLFMPGELAMHMSFVRSGQLEYIQVDRSGARQCDMVDNETSWVAEPVLWMTDWTHLGHLTTILECELLLVDPEKFSEVIHLNPMAFAIVSLYARNFVKWIVASDADTLTDINQGDRVFEMMELENASSPKTPKTGWPAKIVHPRRSSC